MISILRTPNREFEPRIIVPFLKKYNQDEHFQELEINCSDNELNMIKEEWVDFFWSVSAWVRWRFGIN